VKTYLGQDGQTYSLGMSYWQLVFHDMSASRRIVRKLLLAVFWLVVMAAILLFVTAAPHAAYVAMTTVWILAVLSLLRG
jgi:hypothetical protein